jgi:hypothetical protein
VLARRALRLNEFKFGEAGESSPAGRGGKTKARALCLSIADGERPRDSANLY